jgi:hypothetical protein
MADWNPFKEKPAANTADPTNAATTTTEKSPAEMLAESLATANRPLMERLESLTRELEAVKTQTTRPVAAAEPTSVASVFDDEDAAFAQRIGPIAMQNLTLAAKMAYNEIKQEYHNKGYGEVFGQFEDDIKGILEGSPLLQADGQGGSKPCRGDYGYIRNVIDMVIGRAAIKAGMKFGGRDKGFFIEGAGGSDGSSGNAVPEDGLSDSQRRVFSRMKVSSEDAKKTMAKLKFIS